MRKILYFNTNRNANRQNRLLDILTRESDLLIITLEPKGMDMAVKADYVYNRALNAIRIDRPHIVLVRADRFEQLPIAMAATFSGVRIAHLEGGDVSGAIDNHVRHAISKLAHIHFPTHEEAKERLVRMGENPEYIHNFGSLDAEIAAEFEGTVVVEEPYIVVLHHVIDEEKDEITKLAEALKNFPMKKIFVRSNTDYGFEGFVGREFSQEEFLRLLQGATAIVGNSSAGLKEAPAMGIPFINIGNRQQGRHFPNLGIHATYDEIPSALERVVKIPHVPQIDYYRHGTARNIADVLVKGELPKFQKFYFEL